MDAYMRIGNRKVVIYHISTMVGIEMDVLDRFTLHAPVSVRAVVILADYMCSQRRLTPGQGSTGKFQWWRYRDGVLAFVAKGELKSSGMCRQSGDS
jgi:hypothetical protein